MVFGAASAEGDQAADQQQQPIPTGDDDLAGNPEGKSPDDLRDEYLTKLSKLTGKMNKFKDKVAGKLSGLEKMARNVGGAMRESYKKLSKEPEEHVDEL